MGENMKKLDLCSQPIIHIRAAAIMELAWYKLVLALSPLNLTINCGKYNAEFALSLNVSSTIGQYGYGIAARATSLVWLGMGRQGIGV